MASGQLSNSAEFGNAMLRVSIHRKMVPRLKNRLRFAEFCMDGSISLNDHSRELRWNTMLDIDVSTTALTEGAAGTEITTFTLTGTSTIVREYGRWGTVSSLARMVWTETEREELSDILAYNGSKVLDQVFRNQAYETTNALYSSGVGLQINGINVNTGWSSLSYANAHDIAYLEGHFNENDCEGFEQLNGSYALLVHGRTERHIKTDLTTGKLSWANIFQHTEAGQKRISGGYIGTILNTSLIRTNNLTSNIAISTNNTAYSNVALAKWGVGKMGLGKNGANVDVITKTPGPNSTDNPLNMFSTIGWKALSGALLLSSTRVIRYYDGTKA